MERMFEIIVDKDKGKLKVIYSYSTANRQCSTLVHDEQELEEQEVLSMFHEFLKIWCKQHSTNVMFYTKGEEKLFGVKLFSKY